MKRFGESGRFIGLSDTITLDPDWFATVSLGAGDGASYLPDHRIDAFINRKLLSQRQLVATLGTGYYRAPDGHTDRNVSLGATYYFSEPWIVQGEVRFNNSRPGSVNTRQQFVAVAHETEIDTAAIEIDPAHLHLQSDQSVYHLCPMPNLEWLPESR